MASAKRIKTFTVELQHKPGALAQVMGTFREQKVNTIGTWSWAQKDNKAYVIFIGDNAGKTEEALKNNGLSYTAADACLCECDDRLGVFYDTLQKAAKAGVNLHAAYAVGTAGKCAYVLWAEEGQHSKLCQALGC
ncbi:MAG TPA: hypothetical protein VI895_01630 [Bdellovibrionota bacterium]|nr:hypothetical protein [Bdellovibrionota bacterium]